MPIVLRVREIREAKGWSQAELADRAGIRRATLSAIESGQTKGVDFATLERLAKALEVDPGYLIVKRGR
jgi:transcriptional regulator with XRE-family HTH domain